RGNDTFAPIAGAESARAQMFDNIRDRAVETLFKLFLGRSAADVRDVSRSLESEGTLTRAFGSLDVNGDGRVSFTDLMNYNGVGADVINPFIAIIVREMELGAGGEDISTLPGATLDTLGLGPEQLQVRPMPKDAQISGLSQFIQPGSQQNATKNPGPTQVP